MFVVSRPKNTWPEAVSRASFPSFNDMPLAPQLKKTCSSALQWTLGFVVAHTTNREIREMVDDGYVWEETYAQGMGLAPTPNNQDGEYHGPMQDCSFPEGEGRFELTAYAGFDPKTRTGTKELYRLIIEEGRNGKGMFEFRSASSQEHLRIDAGLEGQWVSYTDPSGKRRSELGSLFPPLVTYATRQDFKGVRQDADCVPWNTFDPVGDSDSDADGSTGPASNEKTAVEDDTDTMTTTTSVSDGTSTPTSDRSV